MTRPGRFVLGAFLGLLLGYALALLLLPPVLGHRRPRHRFRRPSWGSARAVGRDVAPAAGPRRATD